MQRLQQFAKACGKKVTYHTSKMIFQTGDKPEYFYLLERGYVKVYSETESGQTITLAIYKPGDAFGVAELFSQRELHECSAASFQEVTFYAISLEQLQARLESDPSLWQAVSQLLAEKISDSHELILTLSHLTVPKRLAWFLQRYAHPSTDGTLTVDIPLSHEEISFIINCSRQKVTSYLNEWRQAGWISYERGNIQIRQSDLFFQ